MSSSYVLTSGPNYNIAMASSSSIHNGSLMVPMNRSHLPYKEKFAFVWGGNNSNGELLLEPTANSSFFFPCKMPLPSPLPPVASISCGLQHTILLTTTNKLYAWGNNANGELGLGAENNVNNQIQNEDVPAHKVRGLPPIHAVACGRFHTVAISTSGEAFTWGHNNFGALGINDVSAWKKVYAPKKLDFPRKARGASCGEYHSVVWTEEGELWGWGSNSYGELGLGHAAPVVSSPTKISLPSKEPFRVLRVSCGSHHNIALCAGGELYGWGHNEYSQLGLPNSNTCYVPKRITCFQGNTIISISCGAFHTAVLHSSGLCCFGNNSSGMLGLGHTRPIPPSSKPILPLKGILEVQCGRGDHTIAICANGVFGWGRNNVGQLGIGHNVDSVLPIQMKIEPFSLLGFVRLFAERYKGIGGLLLLLKVVREIEGCDY